ncbi:MAG: PEPxxWA-CTERM sorting domain-containing protein [Rhodocyclaceae bacterium]|nr:PEPxxWA-CTERM sorting domain-containing protein [Rhodocyclaceae bacterium]
MKPMKPSPLVVAVMSAATLMAGNAMAASWTHFVPAPAASPITVESSSVIFASSPADVWWYDGNIPGGQSAANVLSTINAQYGTSMTMTAFVGACDSVGSCVSASGGNGTGTAANTFSNATPFDYLAVHFGRGQLLFHWTAPQTSFTIQGLPRGLSDYRAFTSAVPEPETYAMMLAGLGLMGAVARRRRAA